VTKSITPDRQLGEQISGLPFVAIAGRCHIVGETEDEEGTDPVRPDLGPT
jgi:hypothetical protein